MACWNFSPVGAADSLGAGDAIRRAGPRRPGSAYPSREPPPITALEPSHTAAVSGAEWAGCAGLTRRRVDRTMRGRVGHPPPRRRFPTSAFPAAAGGAPRRSVEPPEDRAAAAATRADCAYRAYSRREGGREGRLAARRPRHDPLNGPGMSRLASAGYGKTDAPSPGMPASLVAGGGFEPPTFGL